MKSPKYKVLPLPVVQKGARSELSREQLRAGIKLAKKLCDFPAVAHLSIEPCGDGMELRIEHPAIGKQGWLRAIFWVYEKEKIIYLVDLFWKKTNRISRADLLRIDNRIKRLKAQLQSAQKPWAASA
jgi:phage-related protein